MKQITTLTLVLTLSQILMHGIWAEHQLTPSEEQSRARREIEAFWKSIDKAQNAKRATTVATHAKSAGTKLKAIQKKDPGFDASPLQAALNGLSAEPAPAANPEMNTLRKALAKLKESEPGSQKFKSAMGSLSQKIKAAQKNNAGPELDAIEAEFRQISGSYLEAEQAKITSARDAAKLEYEFALAMKSVLNWPEKQSIRGRTAEERADARAKREALEPIIALAADERFAAFRQPGGSGRGAKDYLKDLDKVVANLNRRIAEEHKNGLNAGSTDAFTAQALLQTWQAYAAGLLKLYPGRPNFQAAHDAASAALAELGSDAEIEARFRANGRANAAKVRMPAPRNKDATVAEEVRNAFNNSGNTAEILRIHVTTPQWTIIRNALTSVIEGRTQEAAIATRQPGGECLLYNATIYQQHDGSAYGPARMYGFSNVEMDCANVK